LKGVRYTYDERGRINTGATVEEDAPEAKRITNRDEAEAEVVRQLESEWKKNTDGTFVIGKSYPAVISLNGKERRMAVFKKKSGGPLYAESLDTTIYGPSFTQYKVGKGGKLEEVGSRNLYGKEADVANEKIAEFNALFEQPETQEVTNETTETGQQGQEATTEIAEEITPQQESEFADLASKIVGSNLILTCSRA
jgi:hypothetical protein